MIRLLAKWLIKQEWPTDRRRRAYGMLCGVVGIVLNLLLFVGKLVAGLLSASISVTADALNNLSDAGSSAVTLIGFRLAGRKPDAGHPYGHGRVEYITGLAVSAIILLMALELIRDSVGRILSPVPTAFSPVTLIVLLLSIAVKGYMAFYNFQVGKQWDSAAIRATAKDSLSDCVATAVVVLGVVGGSFVSLPLDGWCGVIVALFIGYAGISSAKETLDLLLGRSINRAYVEQVEDLVMTFDPQIIGIHDLLVHDYGPGRQVISLHAEVPASGDILALHDMIDNLEKMLAAELGCQATVHMDPVVTNDPLVDRLRLQTAQVIHGIDPALGMHDFRVVSGPTHINLIFDLVVPFEHPLSDAALKARVAERLTEVIGEGIYAVIHIDHDMCQ